MKPNIIILILTYFIASKANSDDNCGYLGKVVSKGNNSGADFYVTVNGSDWKLQTGRGWSFITFDRYTGAQKSSNHFDPYGKASSVGPMIDYITNQIDDGDIVCFGIYDEGSENMTTQAWNALRTLGYSGISIGYRESYAAIGRKNGGLIKEKKEKRGTLGLSNGTPAIVSGCIVGCQYRCNTCSDAPLKCKQCKSHSTRQNNPPNCDCKLGYMDDGKNLACLQCSHKCNECRDNVNKCNSCSHSTRQNAPICGCIPNHYEDGSAECKLCDSKCQECSAMTTCTSCKSGLFRQETPQCNCQAGYYDNGQPLCKKCQHPCVNCSNENTCTSCVARANAHSFPSCTCQDGYYEDSSKQCQQCTDKCSKCSSQNTCTQCKVGTGRSGNLSQNCKCNDGWFEAGGGNVNCQQCISNCKECSNISQCQQCHYGYYKNSSDQCVKCPDKCSKCSDQNTCTECKAGNQRSDDLSKNCSCNDGWFESTGGDLDCVKCPSLCKTCTFSPTCLTCIDEYFKDSSNQCQSCHQKCSNCSDQNSCTGCKIGVGRSGDLAKNCICNDGWYENASGSLDCVKCQTNCDICSVGSQCQTCSDGYYKDVSNLCQKCPSKCGLCSDSITCTQCKPGTGRSGDLLKNCKCIDEWFEDVSGNLNCQKCTSPCNTCTSSSSCLSCIDGYLYDTVNKVCNQCTNKCSKCSSDINSCTECKPGRQRSGDLSKNCRCNDGWYEDAIGSLDCVQCQVNCSICAVGSECQTCNDGYFKDNANQCQQCSDKCSKCILNKNKCSECIMGIQRSGDLSKNCKCNDGWYEDAMGSLDCHKCQTNCAVCNTGSQCDQCIDGYYKDAGNQCQKCPEKCYKCSDQNTCIECKLGQGRNNDLSSNCGCQDGWFESIQKNLDCKQCQHPCVKCSSQYHCLSCLDEAFREKNQPCNCLPMSFENIDKKCTNCNPKCKSCKTYDYCLSCNKPNRIFPNCNCIQGYYEDLQQNCQKCDSGCLSCKQRSDKCTVCVIGVGRKQSPSNCACQDGYFSVEGKNNCKICPPQCSKCTSYQQCTECSNKEFLLPLCNQQKQGNFSLNINNGQPQTIRCNKKCLNCTDSSNQCTQCGQGLNRSNQIPGCDCIQGYHDQNGERQDCIKCPEMCESWQYQNICYIKFSCHYALYHMLTSISSSQCSSCSKSKFLILNAYTQMCECEKEMIYDKINKTCKKCLFYKGNCLSQCPRSTKADYSNNICLQQNPVYQISVFFILPVGCFLSIFISAIIYKYLSQNVQYLFITRKKILKNNKDQSILTKENQVKSENFQDKNQNNNIMISVQNESIITL